MAPVCRRPTRLCEVQGPTFVATLGVELSMDRGALFRLGVVTDSVVVAMVFDEADGFHGAVALCVCFCAYLSKCD